MTDRGTLIICDNSLLLPQIIRVCDDLNLKDIHFACSYQTHATLSSLAAPTILSRYDVHEEIRDLVEHYNLIISVHCKQIFPADLVRAVRCVNFHPGFNPHNRGWLPHVFSLMNGKPAGITIHEIDDKIDHGPVIYQEKIRVFTHETSGDVYARIIQREIELFREHIQRIIAHDYVVSYIADKGNYNSRSDFEKFRQIKLDSTWTAGQFLAFLRAMTFPGVRNAYYVDEETGQRCYVTIRIERHETG